MKTYARAVLHVRRLAPDWGWLADEMAVNAKYFVRGAEPEEYV